MPASWRGRLRRKRPNGWRRDAVTTEPPRRRKPGRRTVALDGRVVGGKEPPRFGRLGWRPVQIPPVPFLPGLLSSLPLEPKTHSSSREDQQHGTELEPELRHEREAARPGEGAAGA